MEKLIADFSLQIHKWSRKKRDNKKLMRWEKAGRPYPPPHIIKQNTLKAYANKHGLHTLVETGTFYGDMVEAMKSCFDKIYSIELSKELFEKAKNRFKDDKNVTLIYGNSATELEYLLPKLTWPTLFWLDGHYSEGVTAKGEKDTPIYEELSHIFNSEETGHVIIIDDARCFGSNPAYPSLEELKTFIHSKRNNLHITVKDDSIRIEPA